MEEWLGAAAQKLVRNGMLVEHDLGRLYAQQLENAVNQYECDKSADCLLDILTNTMAYADLLKRHIDRENTVVFQFAEKNLPLVLWADLDKKIRKFEEDRAEFLTSILDELNRLEQSSL